MAWRQSRLRRQARALERHNPATVKIWGRWGILHALGRGELFPLPFTFMRLWMRRGEWQVFHISEYDLVD